MDVYLDNHSTTPCDPRVLEAMLPWFTAQPGNAASRSHKWGYAARTATEQARGQLAERLGCSPKELVFTSGATEADNLAVLGVLRANRARGNHLVTVATEHKAVLDAAKHATTEGFEVTVLAPEPDGTVDPAAVEAALTDRTVLVSVMWANNEVGTLQPIERIVEVCHARDVWVHTDAAQALSTCALDVRAVPVDLMSLSAHKAYGPKGVGALYVRRGRPRIAVEPLQYGGGHERGMRSGTLPVPLIVGFGACAALFDPSEVERVRGLRDTLRDGLLAVGGVHVNGSAHRLAGNLNVAIEGVEAEALMLGCRDIAMSSGSACTSESLEPSYVLRAMGLDRDRAASSLRFGVGRFNTEAEIAYAVEKLTAKIAELRSMAHLYE
ncbi:MAG: aminotransferase class V-fold PLP-dependent enzyme [Alphaproteobacteria bacterium]|nr:aminotransferase class V-fold PLP-dependent enzyme [Alphaproteobacteria bacterium]